MHTYEIMLSKKFLSWHPRKGQPTNFAETFRNAKIHTMRGEYDAWNARFEQIYAGEACISVKIWEGESFRSKKIEIARLTREDGISLQRLDFIKNTTPGGFSSWNCTEVLIDGHRWPTDLVAHNDGLSKQDWLDWFFRDPNFDPNDPVALINFTSKRYNK